MRKMLCIAVALVVPMTAAESLSERIASQRSWDYADRLTARIRLARHQPVFRAPGRDPSKTGIGHHFHN